MWGTHIFSRCAVCRARWRVHVLSGTALNVNKPQRGRPWQGGCFEPAGTSLWFPHTTLFFRLPAMNLLHLADRWPFSSLLFTQCTHKHWPLVQRAHVTHTPRLCSPWPGWKRVLNVPWLDDGWAWQILNMPSRPQSSVHNAPHCYGAWLHLVLMCGDPCLFSFPPSQSLFLWR